MKKRELILGSMALSVVAIVLLTTTRDKRVLASQTNSDTQASQATAQFTADGKLKLPVGFRRWVFWGAPLTPNALNDGQATFPEFHHVYVEQKNLDVYLKTGVFRKEPF